MEKRETPLGSDASEGEEEESTVLKGLIDEFY